MKNVILAVALTALTFSATINLLYYKGRIGSAQFRYVQLFEDEKSLTAYAAR